MAETLDQTPALGDWPSAWPDELRDSCLFVELDDAQSHDANQFPSVWCPWQEDDVLQFLSREEQECIQFFEKTIDSLEESLEENDQELGQVKPRIIHSSTVEVVDGPLASSPSPAVIQSTLPAKQQSPKDQDIIDLVCSGPDMVQNKGHIFNPTSPGRTIIGCCVLNQRAPQSPIHLTIVVKFYRTAPDFVR